MASPAENTEAFWRLIKSARYGYVVVFVTSIAMNVLVLTSPVYMMQMYDRVLMTGSVETLVFLTLVCGVAMAILGALDAVRSAILSRIGAWLERTLRFHILSGALDLAFERGNAFGQQLLGDLHTIKSYLGSAQVTPIFDAPWAPLFILVIWIIHPALGIFATVSAIILFAIAYATDVLTRKKTAKLGADQASLNRFTQQVVNNHDIVLGMGMASAVFVRLRGLLERIHAEGGELNDLVAVLTGASKFLRLFVQIGVLGLGGYLVIEGSMTSGGMLGASIILGRALAPIEQAIGSWRTSVAAYDAFQRVSKFFAAVGFTQSKFSLPEPRGAISVEGLGYRAPGKEKPIVQNVSFTLEPGTVLAIIGPSGAGKTTLCRLLVGSLKSSVGKVRLDGADISSWDRAELGLHVGYLPQTIELFEGSVRENIARFRETSDEEVVEAAELARCHDLILHLTKGYETNVGEAGNYLSGGERQRIGLARAAFGQPRFLVLDEPNSNLDNEGEQALLGAMEQLKRAGSTIIIVTHRPSLLSAVDMIAILRDGTLDRIGERDKVLKDLGVQAMPAQRPQQAGMAG
jgi:ATP-binding cassette subfamily C exporter for protease/lipase